MPSPPAILAIETTQREGGIALQHHLGSVHIERLETTGRRRRESESLMVLIDRASRECSLRPSDIDVIAVSIGPGGFTGTRIGITTAKVLGEFLNAKIVAVPSALVAAESYRVQEETPREIPSLLGVALAAKHESVWWTVVQLDRNAGACDIVNKPGMLMAEALDLSGIDLVLADQYFPDSGKALCARQDVPVHKPRFLPEACLNVGRRKFERGDFVDPLHLAPLYAREPEAVRLWKSRNDA